MAQGKWLDLKHTYLLKGKLLFSTLGVVCIALGTIINMVGVGYLIQFFTWAFDLLPLPHSLLFSGITLVVSTLLFTLGVSLYLKTRMGVAPIDAVAPSQWNAHALATPPAA